MSQELENGQEPKTEGQEPTGTQEVTGLEALEKEELIKLVKETRQEAASRRVDEKKSKEYENVMKEYNELKQAKEAEERKALEKKGEYSKIIQNLEAKLKEKESFEAKLKIYEANEQAEREALLSSKELNEDEKETFKELPLKALRKIIDLKKIAKGDYSPGSQSGDQRNEKVDINKMSVDEMIEYQKRNPEAYNKLVKEFRGY